MKVLALPRDVNPYQECLYAEMRRAGVQVAYLGELTPSRTLNLVLLPLETLVRAAAGWRVVHLHWVFGFALPGTARRPGLRRVAQAVFTAWLLLLRVLGVTLVWTAHNTLPHDRIFHDDLRARRALVRRCSLVIAHSEATLDELAEMGARPARAVVLPIGRIGGDGSTTVEEPRDADGTTRLLFFGNVAPYKGVEDLIAALHDVPPDDDVRLDVVGACPDAGLRRRLTDLAASAPHPVALSLDHVPDDHLDRLLADSDAVVLPFRRVTTSSSAVTALDHGRPVIVPDLPGLRDLPDGAALRYDGTTGGLTSAIRGFAAADDAERRARCAAARSHAPPTWAEIARRTVAALRDSGAPA
jgi:glycosyltransferase involved in cell wall biosynthesis